MVSDTPAGASHTSQLGAGTSPIGSILTMTQALPLLPDSGRLSGWVALQYHCEALQLEHGVLGG